jgi:hypothetical protein
VIPNCQRARSSLVKVPSGGDASLASSAPPTPSPADLREVPLRQVRAAFSPECYQRRPALTLAWLAFDAPLYGGAIVGVFLANAAGLRFLLRVWWRGMVRYRPDRGPQVRAFRPSKAVTGAFAVALSVAAYLLAGGVLGVVAAVVVPFLVFTWFIAFFGTCTTPTRTCRSSSTGTRGAPRSETWRAAR